jgi:hypothetical protein
MGRLGGAASRGSSRSRLCSLTSSGTSPARTVASRRGSIASARAGRSLRGGLGGCRGGAVKIVRRHDIFCDLLWLTPQRHRSAEALSGAYEISGGGGSRAPLRRGGSRGAGGTWADTRRARRSRMAREASRDPWQRALLDGSAASRSPHGAAALVCALAKFRSMTSHAYLTKNLRSWNGYWRRPHPSSRRPRRNREPRARCRGRNPWARVWCFMG